MFKKILVPLDGSPIAEQAVPVAASIARAGRASLVFILVHQRITPMVQALEELARARWRDDNRYLESIAKETRSAVDVPITHDVPAGDAAEMICMRALDEGADLIVMTSHGRTGFSRAWIGSVADAVVRRSHVPVLMLRVAETQPRDRVAPHFRRVLVPLDGSRFSIEALEPAVALARVDEGALILLRVVHPVPMSTVTPVGFAATSAVEDEDATRILVQEATHELEAIARELSDRGVPHVETHVIVEPGIARAILDFANRHRADAIAMSTHGRGTSRLVVGSIADKLLRGSAIPILQRRPQPHAADARLVTAEEIEQQLTSVSGD